MKKAAIITATLTALVLMPVAHAKDLGMLDVNDVISQKVGKHTFNDVYNFKLDAGFTYDITLDLNNAAGKVDEKFKSFSFELLSGSSVLANGSFASDLVATGLAAGNYKFVVQGKGLEDDSKYVMGSKLTIAAIPLVSSVPEPSSFALFLAGLGLIGGIATRRKSKSQ